MNLQKRIYVVIGALASICMLTVTGVYFIDSQKTQKLDAAKKELMAQEYEPITQDLPSNEDSRSSPDTVQGENLQEIKTEVYLEVPFYSQAPDGDWSLPWKEACEESSVIQAYYFVKWKSLSKSTFKKEVLSIVETQEKILWKYVDTTVAETAMFLEEHYNYSDYEIINNPTIEQLKWELAKWHPIVAPFAGKELKNPFFSDGWPRYHMLVIIGYNDTQFITNDVGTSRGKNYPYSYDIIMNALHDLVPLWEWDILDGAKRVLVMK